MRSEQEMFQLILGFAKADERIRAVYMNGSRANPNVPKDDYQDYDIVYVVTETNSFIEKRDWLLQFGEIAIVQEPDWMDTLVAPNTHFNFDNRYVWLMLFKDYVRIDLSIEVIEEAKTNVLSDKMTVILLDKDGVLPILPSSTDVDYHVKRPTAGQYFACCNEFWWCLNNVGKGIVRDEIPYAMQMYQIYVHNMLDRMVEWYIGTLTNFSLSAGKMGKYFKKYLPSDLYTRYIAGYCDGDYHHIWDAVFSSIELFRDLAKYVASIFSYDYIQRDDDNICDYLRYMRKISEGES